MKNRFLHLFILLISTSLTFSQEDINQFDHQGKRHGVWKKTYKESNQIRYEGTFRHGKEIGVFRYYCKDCKSDPSIIKTYNDKNDIAAVVYYSKNGRVLSDGKMQGKNRIGTWVYYHKNGNGIMTKEFYVDGKLHGLKTTFYQNNKIAEKVNYEMGLKQGINTYYSPQGIILKKLIYSNNELHGPALYYDAFGNISLQGSYKNDRKYGVWKSYKEGKLIKEETFPN